MRQEFRSRGRRGLPVRARRGPDPESLRALQRARALRRDGRAGRHGSAQRGWPPATTRAWSRRASDGPLLRAAADPNKDQTYMLARAPERPSSARLWFPLGELTKPEVRELRTARRAGGGRQGREPGPLLPGRHRPERLPRAPWRNRGHRRVSSSTATGRWWAATPRPRALHDRPAARALGIAAGGARSTWWARTPRPTGWSWARVGPGHQQRSPGPVRLARPGRHGRPGEAPLPPGPGALPDRR